MSTTSRVLPLDDHRGRRDRRLRRALALLAPDPGRSRLATQLVDLLGRVGGDRAAIVWLDEFEPVRGRIHVVVDLLRDRPRRGVELSPLLDAWDRGVPGFLDRPELTPGARNGAGSGLVVSLGSDGRRAWFTVVEGSHPRGPLSGALADEVAFRTGEIAGALLHPEQGEAFAGWRMLGEAARGGSELEDRAATRLLVLRFVRAFLDEGAALDPDELDERGQRLMRAVQPWGEDPEDAEAAAWLAIVSAAKAGDLEELRDLCAAWGGLTADEGDMESSVEVHDLAYRLSVLLGDAVGGARVARAMGRAHRDVGRWGASEHWYATSVGLAQVVEDPEAEAVALDGWANTLRVKGAFPAARRRLVRALDLARTAGSAYALGSVHQSLMTVAALAGETGAALEHGWASVESYATARDQLRALVTVAGLLLELEEAHLAERAYQVALEHLEEPYFRLFALDGHAHAAALRGDRDLYESRSRRLDQEDWRVGGPDFEGQVYLYRGRAWEKLERPARARSWFERALALAESHGLNKTLFEAQGGLARLDRGAVAPTPAEPGRLPATAAASMVDRLDRVDRRLAGVTG